MRSYRLALLACTVLVALALIIPMYTASQISGSFVMWRAILVHISPAGVLLLLLYLLPRISSTAIIAISLVAAVPFFSTTLLGRISPVELLLFLLGISALILAARSHPPTAKSSS